jgi:hypothetical protein
MLNTRTCAFPGDHEHDHEMCIDSMSERADLDHGLAIAEDIERGIAHLDDETLGLSLEFALLLDVSAPRNAIAIRVLRDRLHQHALDEYQAVRNAQGFEDSWRGTQRSGVAGAPHGKGCSCCGAGVSQWR